MTTTPQMPGPSGPNATADNPVGATAAGGRDLIRNLGWILPLGIAIWFPLVIFGYGIGILIGRSGTTTGAMLIWVLVPIAILTVGFSRAMILGGFIYYQEDPAAGRLAAILKGASRGFVMTLTLVVLFLCLMVGFCALIIPGLYLWYRFSLTDVIIMREDTWGKTAMMRSWDLTRIEPWSLVGNTVITIVPVLLLRFLDRLTDAILAALLTPGGGIYLAISVIVTLIWTALGIPARAWAPFMRVHWLNYIAPPATGAGDGYGLSGNSFGVPGDQDSYQRDTSDDWRPPITAPSPPPPVPPSNPPDAAESTDRDD